MDFVARLIDLITPGANTGTESLKKQSAEAKATAASLKALDVAQAKAARRAELSAKAFNPDHWKRQVKAEQEVAAAKERALQQLGLGLSKKEQEAKAEKKSAEERRKAAREAATEKLRSQIVAATGAMVAFAGASSALELTKIAIGWQGMARLQMLTFRAQMGLRQLFRGVDSKPLERAYGRFLGFFDKSTQQGKAFGIFMTRAFNGFFQAVEKAEPYVEAFGLGLLLAGLKAEELFLRAQIALDPYIAKLEDATKGTDIFSAITTGTVAVVALLAARAAFTGAVMAGRLALGLASAAAQAGILAARAGFAGVALIARLAPGLVASATAATGAAAPFLALAAAIGAVIAAGYQFSQLAKEWDTDALLRSVGLKESATADYERMLDMEAAARKKAGKKSLVREVDTLPAPGGDKAAVAALNAGKAAGEAMGAGLVAGLKSSEAAAASGGASLARAADAGVRKEADIHSPSRKMQRNAQYMGEGAERGLQAAAPRVQRAAERALVPSMPAVPAAAAAAPTSSSGRAESGRAAQVVNLHIEQLNIGAGASRQDISGGFNDALVQLFHGAQIAIGGAA